MKNEILSAGLICLLVVSGSAAAANPASVVQWERGHALAAAHSVDHGTAVAEIANVSSLANADITLDKLRHLETRADWPLPAREAALLEFTRALAELPRAAVAPGVIEHLQTYESRTLVPDEDHPATLVPLFNIGAAATGVENSWQRKSFSIEAIELIGTDPATLVSTYLEAGDRNQRSGYLDALRQADLNDIAAVQQAALAAFGHAPELTPLLGLTAVATADTPTVRQLLLLGDGAGLAAALRELEQRLPPADLESLLIFAIEEAPTANAGLAIAAWWPGLRHTPALRDLLLEKLADPELGSAAALALAAGPDVQTIRALQQTARGDTVAARRAQMALDINREQMQGGMRP